MLNLEKIATHDRVPEVVMGRGSPMQQGLLDDIALMLGRQMAVYTAVCQSMIAEKLALPIADVKALDLITEFDALPTGQLAQLMGISSGGATAMINRLEGAGYVRRDRHPLDRRIIVIRPVPAACEALARERKIVAEEVALLSKRYDLNQLELMHGFLAQCVRALRHDTLDWLENRQPDQYND
jgi:DNA-binding MarR family transcriptional regulator